MIVTNKLKLDCASVSMITDGGHEVVKGILVPLRLDVADTDVRARRVDVTLYEAGGHLQTLYETDSLMC